MKTQIHIDDVEIVLSNAIKDDKQYNEIMDEIKKMLKDEEEKAKAEKGEREKWEQVLVAFKNDDAAIDEHSVFLFKIKEGTDHNLLPDMIRRAANFNNIEAKKENKKVSTAIHAIERVPAKFFKQFDIKRLTKEPLIIINMKNTLEFS